MMRVCRATDGWRAQVDTEQGSHVLLGGMSSEATAVYFVAVWLSAMARNSSEEDETTKLLRQYATNGQH